MTRSTNPAAGSLNELRTRWAGPIEEQLEQLLPPATEAPERLHEAMRYVMFPGGKRLRPLLALVGCQVTGGDMQRCLPAAAATELLHTYSLVHDDLPCMDDDDLRRGRATCHKVYGEAVAVLVGDALQSLAFEAVARGGADCVGVLARASGSRGMVGGQVADLAAEGGAAESGAAEGRPTESAPTESAPTEGPTEGPSLAEVRWIHDHKTGALLQASLEIGALAGGGSGCIALPFLREYGGLMGRLFQIIDDCLDVTAEASTLGKSPGKDQAAEKLTYPAVLGLEGSQAEARSLAEQAAQLAPKICSWAPEPSALDAEVALLQDVATFLVARGC